MTQTLLQRVLATAEKIDGAEAWIHLCLTAADEAKRAVQEVTNEKDDARMNRWLAEPAIKGDARTVLEVMLAAKAELPTELLQAITKGRNPWQIWQNVEAVLSLTNGQQVPQKWPKTPPPPEASVAAQQAAAIAFRVNLPPITNRRSVQAFVACVAAGVSRQYITVKDANALLYAAQAALTAFPKRNARKGGK